MTNSGGECLWWPLELSGATWARESSITADRSVATGGAGSASGEGRKMGKRENGEPVFGDGRGANTFGKFILSLLKSSMGDEQIFGVNFQQI